MQTHLISVCEKKHFRRRIVRKGNGSADFFSLNFRVNGKKGTKNEATSLFVSVLFDSKTIRGHSNNARHFFGVFYTPSSPM